MLRRKLLVGAMAALAVATVESYRQHRKARTIYRSSEPVPALPAHSAAACRSGCVGMGWLFARSPCVKAEVCAGSPLVCAVRDPMFEVQCACPGFELVDYTAPSAAGRASLVVELNEKQVVLGRDEFGHARRLGLTISEGQVASAIVDVGGLDNPEQLSPVEAAFDAIQAEVGATCALPTAETLGVPVQVRGEGIARKDSRSWVHASTQASVKSGPLSVEAVERYARARTSQFERCMGLMFTPRGTRIVGQVQVLVTIDPSGQVTQAYLESDTSSLTGFGLCITGQVANWQTPFRPSNGAEVLLQVTLSTG